ncbi:hypothetical protein MANES_07G129602v8 [Manihot esculenta]|uniref:Uncharacterized protein n=1 Tax=Manihot esculenta TaxID=3983 RepID=A0ACB7HH36_MANES|nr:hypothetical protein MANES_07G129602v8 [Manihot esculenta]
MDTIEKADEDTQELSLTWVKRLHYLNTRQRWALNFPSMAQSLGLFLCGSHHSLNPNIVRIS